MLTNNVQRKISTRELTWKSYLRAPMEAKPTALGLWLTADGLGRMELVPELIAAAIYPGQAAVELVTTHILMLDECGFLMIYQSEGTDWIQLMRPLKVDARLATSECPPPPDTCTRMIREDSRTFAAVGGERRRAREQAERESAQRASRWAQWEQEQERTRKPERPLLLDAPPIGCPDHPNGRFKDCGPCGTGRRRHDRWLAQTRYDEALEAYEKETWHDEEPF